MNLPSPRRPTQNPADAIPDGSAISPKSRSRALPTIINTDSSPQRSDASSQGGPSRPERSPTRSVSSIHSSATINDLTEMLGGAIDAIGLIDSRDTPPPTIMEPKKDRGLSVPTLSAPAEVIEAPKNLPARGASLPGSSLQAARMQPMRQVSGGSISSLQEYNMIQGAPIARPWPAAMMYGGIKRLRAPGDRAKAYAKGINDLAKAESGLREWCAASSRSNIHRTGDPLISVEHAYRPEAARPRKTTKMQALGVKAPVSSTLVPEPMHPRQVSSGSEFPMRADSYTAREISTRMIDPLDQPTALPNNLPYPQLQQQYQIGGGMKPSPSMQSMASVSSKKGFFSSAIGRIGGKRENYSLGPPSGNYQPPGAAKRDVKGLAISGPSQSSGEVPTTRASITGSAPMGPRNPRGSYTPPVNNGRASTEMPSRVSLDQGLARMSSVRSSFDSARQGKMSAPPRSSPMATNNPTVGGGGIAVSDEAMRQMGDVLPHVERGILRIYLQKYLDPMRAIGYVLLSPETSKKTLTT